jgi:hypothetical protein
MPKASTKARNQSGIIGSTAIKVPVPKKATGRMPSVEEMGAFLVSKMTNAKACKG